ncbi:MAG: GTP 3',8-cyclase MoaA [Candidatus Rifleibacteriota bacterium]
MFKYLRLSITDRCNFRCVYCMPEEGIEKQRHENILSYEEMVGVAKVAVKTGVEQIRITGGEPLVRKNLPQLVEKLALIDGLKDLSLTTNGSLLDQYAQKLKSAGLNRVNISIDSLNSETFKKITRVGNLENVLAGVRAALDCGLTPVKINVVLIPGINSHETEDFADFAYKNPVTIRFIERMPFNGPESSELKPVDREYVPQKEVFEIINRKYKLRETQEEETFGPARTYKLGDGQGKIGFISPHSRPYCHNCLRLRLTANGFLLPCLDSDYGFNVRGKNQAEIEKIIADLFKHKTKWRKNHACFGTTYNSSLSKIGG